MKPRLLIFPGSAGPPQYVGSYIGKLPDEIRSFASLWGGAGMALRHSVCLIPAGHLLERQRQGLFLGRSTFLGPL